MKPKNTAIIHLMKFNSILEGGPRVQVLLNGQPLCPCRPINPHELARAESLAAKTFDQIDAKGWPVQYRVRDVDGMEKIIADSKIDKRLLGKE